MKSLPSFMHRGASAGLSLLLLGVAGSAFAARNASTEVGHWMGFARSAGGGGGAGKIVLDLAGEPAKGPFAVQGVISGLPAIQRSLLAMGQVNGDGRLIMELDDPASGQLVGFCDGSVRPINNYNPGSGQDDLGTFEFIVVDPTGGMTFGAMNLLHAFGGEHWRKAGGDPQLSGLERSTGAYSLPGQDTALHCKLGATQVDNRMSSALIGLLRLELPTTPAGVVPGPMDFAMVGSVNSRGSFIMMCDGSVRVGDTNTIIVVCFTGGIAPSPAAAAPQGNAVGHFSVSSFTELIPAVQRGRGGAMSFQWGVG